MGNAAGGHSSAERVIVGIRRGRESILDQPPVSQKPTVRMQRFSWVDLIFPAVALGSVATLAGVLLH
jgi:hypothetical protein